MENVKNKINSANLENPTKHAFIGVDSPQQYKLAYQEFYQGFLPHPTIFKGYENVKQGFSEKVFKIYEKEVKHRREIEKIYIHKTFDNQRRGQWCALTVSCLGLLVAGDIALHGQALTAGIIAALDLTALASTFLVGHFVKLKKN